jgi:hypothetical protein
MRWMLYQRYLSLSRRHAPLAISTLGAGRRKHTAWLVIAKGYHLTGLVEPPHHRSPTAAKVNFARSSKAAPVARSPFEL